MQTFLIIITVVTIVGCAIFCKLIKEVYQKRAELAQLNQQLTQQPSPSTEQPIQTGLERVQQFAAALQIQLEEIDCPDVNYKLFNASYQGDNFIIWASKHNEVIHILTGIFANYPATTDTYWPIIRYCYNYTCVHAFAKVCYAVEDRDNGNKEIELHMTSNTMGLSLEGFKFILDSSFAMRREITQDIDKILQDLSNESNDIEPANTDNKEPNMQEIAMQMTMAKANEQNKENQDNTSNDENWSY